VKKSTERILATHVGSLPRSSTLKQMLLRRQAGGDIDSRALRDLVVAETQAAVDRQIQIGIDVVGNGELGRPGFQTDVPRRMTGFGGHAPRRSPRELTEFPALLRSLMRGGDGQAGGLETQVRAMSGHPAAVAEILYEDLSEARGEIEIFERVSAGHEGRFVERFITAPSPGIIATTMPNQFYDSHERYVRAMSLLIAKEYRLIVDAGFVLQVDAPDLAMERTIMYQDDSLSKYLEAVELYVDAINDALEGLPADRVRLHCCYGNYDGPHVYDVELGDVLPLIGRANVGGLSLELANPRHQHEIKVLSSSRLPDRMVLLPGVIDTSTQYVEHPEVVADRICAVVEAVGDRERVIASTDCGFGTFAAYDLVLPEVAWLKLESLAQGARLATARLWGH
jgi:5-methyltetrahydropteroyltriglutamate--homocysteine methyltransferase